MGANLSQINQNKDKKQTTNSMILFILKMINEKMLKFNFGIKRYKNMNIQFIEELSLKLREILSKSPAGDLDKNIHALLQSAFTKLALVSREEFDVQTEALRRTREKLDQLEKKLAEIEK